jgi:two-component system sensor histidine kinase RpfC
VGDPRHLTDILRNLVGNAVKFTERGWVLLSVDVAAEEEARAILAFEVTDTGIGIAPEAQSRIFESFAQADGTILDRFGGTGLGLAIAQRLAHLQGGEISVTSQIGAGSTFRMELPLGIAEPLPCPLSPLEFAFIAPPSATRSTLVGRLEKRGLRIHLQTVAPGERAALEQALAAATGLHAVLLDQACLPYPIDLLESLSLSQKINGPPLILVGTEPPLRDGQSPWHRHFLSVLREGAAGVEIDRVLRAVSLRADRDAAWPLPAQKTSRPLHILVADDNRINQNVVAKILERGGHSYEIVGNGEEALDALERGRFALVLMDVNMPVMNGLEATKLYRFSAIGEKHLPILALTADATEAMTKRCLDAGMDLCIVKPVEANRLLDIIAEFADPDAAAQPGQIPGRLTIGENRAPETLSLRLLRDLEKLGGTEFAADLAQEFIADAAGLLVSLRAAVVAGDVVLFQSEAHALSSAAANIGAEGVQSLCRQFGRLNLSDRQTCQVELRQLSEEIDRVAQALLDKYPAAAARH